MAQLVAELYVIECNNIQFMQSSHKILFPSPTLTDFSFIEYRPTTDLYQLLLSDNSEQLDVYSTDSSAQKQLTWEESVNAKMTADFSQTEEVQPKKTVIRCNCAKSKCSKNYCQCFRAGRQCSSECNCLNCSNKQEYVHKKSARTKETGGCNCRKSHCQKKYCECHSKGIKCTSKCNCIDCQNTEQEKQTKDDSQENPFVVIDTFYL